MIVSPAGAAETYLAEATRLFSVRGYAATSVGEIQAACGVAPGSGALYKHFRSKRHLLERVVARHVERMRAERDRFLAGLPADPDPTGEVDAVLRHVADATWSVLRAEHDALRTMLRDLEPFPELLDALWGEVGGTVYGTFAEWIASAARRGTVDVADPEATSAVLLASLTYYPILESLIGRRPGDVGPDRYREAWLRHARATLAPGPGRRSGQ